MESNSALTENQLQEQVEQQKALASVILRIRESLELGTIFQTTVTAVRQLLNADRVAVFQFNLEQDWEGEFICEDVAPGWESVILAKVHDHCFGEQFADDYQQGRVQAVTDIYGAHGFGQVVGKDVGAQSKLGIVGIADCFIETVNFAQRRDRPERFAVHDIHVMRDFQYGRLHEPALGKMGGSPTAGDHFGTLLHGPGNHFFKAVALPAGCHRADIDTVESIADAQRQHFFFERGQKLVIDSGMHIQPLGRRADLAAIEKRGESGRPRRDFHRRGRHHNKRIVAGSFNEHRFETHGG